MKTRILLLTTVLMALFTSCADETSAYEVIDEDADENISREEYLKNWYEAGYFNLWDRNRDGKIDEEEWNSGLKQYYEDYTFTETTYGEWDMDSDNFLDEEELANGQFTIYDTDGDGDIERAEYEPYHKE